jgi:acetyl esterase
MTVDAASVELFSKLTAGGKKPVAERTPAAARADMRRLLRLLGPGPEMARVKEVTVPGGPSDLPARLTEPEGGPAGLILYLHGGGWVCGSIEIFDPLARCLAAATRCAVLSVGYRRAPESPYPGPVDDAWAALQWAATASAELLNAELPLMVAGDSAGANLAIATTLRARERGGPRIDGQLLIYPITDSDLSTSSYLDPANQLMLTREVMSWYWDQYLPDPARRSEPEASPLRAHDLTGLPPAVVITAERDVLRDEGEAYAKALAKAGVPVAHRRFNGQMHGFLMMVDLLPGSAEGFEYLRSVVPDLFLRPDLASGKGVLNRVR